MYFNGTCTFSPDATMDENLTSQTIDLNGQSQVSVTFYSASATHVGTGGLEVSDDGVHWAALTIASAPAASSGSAWTGHFDVTTGALYARVTYTYTSGTGTLQAWFTAKE